MTADVVELARTLIGMPSPNPPGDERAVVGRVRELMARLGLPAGEVVAADASRPNLVSTVDFGPGGRHLVLCGHLDTKPVGDAEWTVSPFAGDMDGDRLYGLGSADMKAAVAAMLVAVASVAESGPDRGRVTLLLAADEENGARYGARHVASAAPIAADGAVIGEPGGIHADFDRLHLVSRGILRARIVARAEQGHSSLSGEPGKVNAGVDAARAALAVATDSAPSYPRNVHDLTGWEPTVNTGLKYGGGVGYGVLPGRITVDTEVRLLPGMQRDDVLDELATIAGKATEGRAVVEPDEPPNDWLPASAVDPADPLADAARAALRRVLGTEPPASVFPGTTDATWFEHLMGVPTLPALGPGLLRRAHGADEWVSVAAVRTSVALYADLVRTFCPGGDR